jgi:hypothetical protein
MSTRVRIAAAVAAVAALLGVQLIAGALPAQAVGSQLSFVTASPVQTAFGGNWNVQLAARFADPTTVAIPSDQATVDVFVSGVDGPFASHLPIQPDGSVYVSQSTAATLPPGEYQLTAQLVPISGSYVDAAQTTTPLVLSISAFSIDAKIEIDDASVAAEEPVVEAVLSGQFVGTTDAVPAGTWAFTVTARGQTVVEEEIAQEAGATDPLRYAIPGKLDKGVDYTVAATFTPIATLEAGLEVAQPQDVTFHTPDGGLGDPIPYPLWLLIVTCVIPLGLAAAVIVLTVQVGRRRGPVADGPSELDVAPEPPPEPAWDPFATAGPVEPAPTQVLPPAEPAQPTQVLPREPGAFTQLITPVKPPQHPEPQDAQDAPTENWSLAQEDPEEPDSQHR